MPWGKCRSPGPTHPRLVRQTGILLDLPGACWRELIPEDPQVTKFNFFYGNDPKGWVTDVPTYGRLRFKGIFPGTDLILEPKSKVLWRIEGPFTGLLEIMGTQAKEKLQAFGIPLNGVGPFVHVPQHSQSSPHQASEALGSNRQREAQTLLWGTYLGGYGADYIQAMALDASGNILVAGYTQSWDFPVPDGYDTTYNGSYDIFAAKLSADGSQLLWGTFIGGYYDEIAWAMALDAGMNIVLVGSSSSYDAPVSAGAFDTSFNGGGPLRLDIYVAKLSAAGNALLWGTYIGGYGDEEAQACALDASGAVVLAGYTESLNIPVPGGFDTELHSDYYDIYLARLSNDGSNLEWGSYLGGSRVDKAASLCLDSNDNIVIAGYTSSNDIPVPGGYDDTLGYYGNMYLAKISIVENILLWGTYLGGNGGDSAVSISIDAFGSVYVLGTTYSKDIPVPGGYDTAFNGVVDMYAAKLSPDGNRLLWGTYLGGNSYDYPYASLLDNNGNMLIVGSTLSDDMPVPSGYASVKSGSLDIYVAKLSSSGNLLQWGTYLGGGREDEGSAAVFDAMGNILVAGFSSSLDFPVPGGYDPSYNGPGGASYADGIIAALSDPASMGQTLYIAAAARTSGAQGTNWRTDGMVLNPTADEICYDLRYFPAGTADTLCETRCLGAKSAWLYSDIIGATCGVSGDSAGSLRIEPTGKLLMTTRTYNQTTTGTYGQSIAAVDGGRAIGAGETAHLIGLKQNPDYRTNIGFAEITGQSADLEVRIFDFSGSLLQTSAFSLQPSAWHQVGLADLGISNLDSGRTEVAVTTGGAVLSYASIVDNRTGDAVFIPAQKYGATDQIVPVVARAKGAQGTDWRTEMAFFNPGPVSLELSLVLRVPDAVFASALNLPAFTLSTFSDLITQAFPEIQGDIAGWIEFSASLDFLSIARIYNQTDQGTYGQEMQPGAGGQGLGVGEVGHLLQLAQKQDYRTNLGFTEISGQATDIEIRFYDISGSLILTSTISLQPYAWRQVGVADLGLTRFDAGRAEIEVISGGAILSYASIVDNRTGDAIFIPVME